MTLQEHCGRIEQHRAEYRRALEALPEAADPEQERAVALVAAEVERLYDLVRDLVDDMATRERGENGR